MARFLKNYAESAGSVPGSPVFIGTQKIDQAVIRVIDFNSEFIEELKIDDFNDLHRFLESDTVSWISIYGLHDIALMKQLGNVLNLHPLVLEDVVNTGQRPKFEEYDNELFMVLKMVHFDQQNEIVLCDQISFVLGKNFLISFQEKPVDVFHPVRERIRHHRGRIRAFGPDYLAYAMLDTIVDNYILSIEALGSRIEELEDAVLEDPSNEVLNQITVYKREINYLRKSIRPARDLIMSFTKCDNDIVDEKTTPFLKDLQDLSFQATEALDSYREMLTDQLGIYNTTISNKLNEIMKLLTVLSAIFIPLSFIAGVYGTNFEYVPELKFRYSYFIFWGFMISVAGFMVRFFKRKGWV